MSLLGHIVILPYIHLQRSFLSAFEISLSLEVIHLLLSNQLSQLHLLQQLLLLPLCSRRRILPLDVCQQLFLASLEQRMLKALLVGPISGLVEVIHVQLPDEAGEIVVFEVFWQHRI